VRPGDTLEYHVEARPTQAKIIMAQPSPLSALCTANEVALPNGWRMGSRSIHARSRRRHCGLVFSLRAE
jgi:hypothetical protein